MPVLQRHCLHMSAHVEEYAPLPNEEQDSEKGTLLPQEPSPITRPPHWTKRVRWSEALLIALLLIETLYLLFSHPIVYPSSTPEKALYCKYFSELPCLHCSHFSPFQSACSRSGTVRDQNFHCRHRTFPQDNLPRTRSRYRRSMGRALQ